MFPSGRVYCRFRVSDRVDQPPDPGNIDDDCYPEYEPERRLDGLVPEALLGNQRTGPAAEQVSQVQAAFLRPPRTPRGSQLVGTIHHVRHAAEDEVHARQLDWNPVDGCSAGDGKPK